VDIDVRDRRTLSLIRWDSTHAKMAQMATGERPSTVAVAPTSAGALDARSWSNRILTLASIGILVLTLYPFRLDFARRLPRPLFPFSLGGWGKDTGLSDNVLNVLLFVPFGFGLAEKLRERGKSRLATLGLTLAAGAALSYVVELLQIYIPPRDSGWDDVFTNSSGAIAGALLFDLAGDATLVLLSQTERKVTAWLTWQRAVAAVFAYVGLWSVVAVQLQKQTRLSNWNTDSVLVIGNSASGHFSSAWQGEIFAFEMWDRGIPGELARRLTSPALRQDSEPDAIVAYRFSGLGPFPDERRLLPDLAWAPKTPVLDGSKGAFLDGKSWLMSPGAVSELANKLKETGQFSLRVLCAPAEIRGVDADIVSISSSSGPANLELGQQGASLAFWFRSALSMQRLRMTWIVPKTFRANEMRDILLSFDGADLRLFLDGKQYHQAYRLGAGAALATFIRRIKARELDGYRYVFYALVFVPAGCLLGFAWKATRNGVGLVSLLFFGLALPPVIFEVVLVHGSRAVSFENIWFSVLLAAAGSIWINADPAGCREASSRKPPGEPAAP
jgi:VanZ like family